MKEKFYRGLYALCFLGFGIFIFYNQTSWKSDIVRQNDMYEFVRKEIADPSVFTIEMNAKAYIKDTSIAREMIIPPDNCSATGRASSFAVKEGGYLLTNKHTLHIKEEYCMESILRTAKEKHLKLSRKDVNIETEFTARDGNGNEYPVSVIAESKNQDLALLRVIGISPKPLEISERKDIRNEAVAAVGTPFATRNTITYGNIASDKLKYKRIVVAIPVSPGNSGGPLITLSDGKVFGIMTEVSQVAPGVPGSIGYAIPAWAILDFLAEAGL